MSADKPVILDEGVMCGRCGSVMDWQDCESCGGEGVYCDYEGIIVSKSCGECSGFGGRWFCISPPDWCEANPRPDHEDTPRHTVEEYVVYEETSQ